MADIFVSYTQYRSLKKTNGFLDVDGRGLRVCFSADGVGTHFSLDASLVAARAAVG